MADSGYPLKKYCITPLLNVETPAENLFNESQIRTRNPIERAFGVWKRRLPILSIGIRLKIRKAQCLIMATAILHNIATIEKEQVLPPLPVEVEEAINFVNNVPHNIAVNRINNINNNNIRDSYIRYFENLL